jgi:cephalosporin hydroxylase
MIVYENFKKLKGDDSVGLKYFSDITPEFKNEADYIPELVDAPVFVDPKDGNGQFSLRNGEILKFCLSAIEQPKAILEIGISRMKTFVNSSTHTIFDNKPTECFYFGVDLMISDVIEFETYQKNVFLYGFNSVTENHLVVEKIKEKVEFLDLIHIDGNHSIESCFGDWNYTKLLRKGGYVVIHDSNNHPGPHFIFDAVDEEKYEKTRYFQDRYDDCGISVYKKLV